MSGLVGGSISQIHSKAERLTAADYRPASGGIADLGSPGAAMAPARRGQWRPPDGVSPKITDFIAQGLPRYAGST
jgi:hypothetical protein